MFDNNVFIEKSCKNVVEDGQVVGFQLETNIVYYRGIPLSMVNDVKINIDGEEIPREEIRCSLDGKQWFTLNEMETVTTYKWEYGEPLIARVNRAGGLEKGEHEVKMTVIVRTAYIPVPLEGVKTRTVNIA